jgi:hypothetical protein
MSKRQDAKASSCNLETRFGSGLGLLLPRRVWLVCGVDLRNASFIRPRSRLRFRDVFLDRPELRTDILSSTSVKVQAALADSSYDCGSS